MYLSLSQIGRVDLVILLDCEEDMCKQRLLARGRSSDRIDDNEMAVRNRIEFFKNNTLPVIHYFETQKKLINVRMLNVNAFVNV